MIARIEPGTARYSIDESFNGIRAFVPAQRNWFVVLFMLAWLGGWVMGETSAISEIFHIPIPLFGDSMKWKSTAGVSAFLVFWLAGWTLGGAWAIANIVWLLFGREIIGVAGSELTYRAEALGIGRTRAFATDQISRMSVAVTSPRSNSIRVPSLFGQGAGLVWFEYGARTYRIGVSLDEAEARQLIQQLKPWLPEAAIESR